MLEHWLREPPADALFAAWVGYKPPASVVPHDGQAAHEKMDQLFAMFGTEALNGR